MSTDAVCPRHRIAQNFLLIWIDDSIDESTEDCQNALAQLRSVVNQVSIFKQLDDAIDFLTDIHEMNAFLIVSNTIGQHFVPLIHDITQLHVIYMLCSNQSQHEQWTKKWIKIKGVHTDIKSICEVLKLVTKQCDRDSIAMSFVTINKEVSNMNLNQLESSFMYTQIFKEILLKMEYNKKSFKDFVLLWRLQYVNNILKLNDIAEFERDYCP
jgi:hypothetical protein